jgi:hypothetical protein
MGGVTRGDLAGLLALALLWSLLLGAGCTGPGAGEAGVTPAATGTVQTLPATLPPITSPRQTPVDLSLPPPKASPYPTPSIDPIVGTWYAPSPDDLTFEFHADGTFTERSPNFRTYQGTWSISEEGEEDFYDAYILDRWGYGKQAHLLLSSGTLYTKGIGTMHRVG